MIDFDIVRLKAEVRMDGEDIRARIIDPDATYPDDTPRADMTLTELPVLFECYFVGVPISMLVLLKAQTPFRRYVRKALGAALGAFIDNDFSVIEDGQP